MSKGAENASSDKDTGEYGGGPLVEYDERVKAGRLRNDDHQRSKPPQSVLS